MTPSARLQAAIEILDEIADAARTGGPPADRIVAAYFRTRRYAGSKDRRAVREHVYDAIRAFGECPPSGRAAMAAMADAKPELAALFDGSVHAPDPLTPDEERAQGGIVPAWLEPLFAPQIDAAEQAALLERAPLDIRVNALKAGRTEIAAHWPDAEPLAASPHALRLPAGTPVEDSEHWRGGDIEIQDLGSQLIGDACEAAPGMRALDLCAGAGGKSLALAAAMRGEGRIVAADIDRGRLSRLPERAGRAGAGIIETLLLDPGREGEKLGAMKAGFDRVLVDAPCSGSGTWRRNPETRWRLTPRRLDRLLSEQARLLDIAAEMVAPGGKIVYAVCSVLEKEGAGQVSAFLDRQDGWKADPIAMPAGRACGAGLLLTPLHDSTDGFFFARLVKL